MSVPGTVAAIIVKRSRVLKPTHKLLWLEYWLLGRGSADGWIGLSQAAIADRLAIHISTIKKCSVFLEQSGMLEARSRSRRQASERRAAFPFDDLLPGRIPDLDEQLRLQTRLDDHLNGEIRNRVVGIDDHSVVVKSDHSVVAESDHSVVAESDRPLRKGRGKGGERGGGGKATSTVKTPPVSDIRGAEAVGNGRSFDWRTDLTEYMDMNRQLEREK